MSYGSSAPGNALNYDVADKIDPRVVPYYGVKGAIFRYVPDVGAAVVLQKQDYGTTNNWTVVGGGGGGVSGLPNTVAFFDNSGAIASVAQFAYDQTTASLSSGWQMLMGVVSSSGQGSMALGFANSGGSPGTVIEANGDGSFAGGYAFGGVIKAGDVGFSQGSFAWGYSSGGASPGKILTDNASGSVAFGWAGNGGIVKASGNGNLVRGYATAILNGFASTVETSLGVNGSSVFGYTENGGWLRAGGNGAFVTGSAKGTFGLATPSRIITGAGEGAIAAGVALNGGNIDNPGAGSVMFGYADGDGSGIGQLHAASGFTAGLLYGYAGPGAEIVSAANQGSTLFGYAYGNNAIIQAGPFSFGSVGGGFINNNAAPGVSNIFINASGARAFGYVDVTLLASQIVVDQGLSGDSNGSVAEGCAIDGSIKVLGSRGSFARGWVGTDGLISVEDTYGSFAFGAAQTSALIKTTGAGSLSLGFAANSSQIRAMGDGSFAGGYANAGSIIAAANGAFVWGGEGVSSVATFAATFGIGTANGSYASLIAGMFADTTGSATNTWNSTDLLFALGNGANAFAKNNAFQVDKDGKMTTTASQKHKAIRLDGGLIVNVSARTDRTILIDSTSGPISVNLPPGEDGLEFFIKDIGQIINPVTIVPSTFPVVDSFDPMWPGGNMSANFVHIQFLNNMWWIIGS